MGKAWRCVTLEKASSLLLPWQWSLLGNCVAMARVSSAMQTWPHPPTSSPAVKSREALMLAECQCWEQQGVCVCVCVWSCAFFFTRPFYPQDANFSLHVTVPQPHLSAVSSTDPWPLPFSGGCLFSWGWNEHGMCGDGSTTNISQPTLLCGLRPLLIGCGAGHSLTLCPATASSR